MRKDLLNVIITFGLISVFFAYGSFAYKEKIEKEKAYNITQEELQKSIALKKQQELKQQQAIQQAKEQKAREQALYAQAQAEQARQQAALLAQQQADLLAQQQAQNLQQTIKPSRQSKAS